MSEPLADALERDFGEYVLVGHESDGETLVDHVLHMPVQSLQEQFEVLTSISNYHWWASADQHGKLISTNNQPRYSQYVLFYPGQRKSWPSSPRNILLKLLPMNASANMPDPDTVHGGNLGKLYYNLMFLVNYDQGQRASILNRKDPPTPSCSSATSQQVRDGQPPLKKRKYASRAGSADVLDADSSGVGGLEPVSSSVTQRSLFDLFSEQLHTGGFIQWRRHLEDVDVVIMNDYCPESGKLKPLKYIHVTASKTDSGEVSISCTCRIYQALKDEILITNQFDDALLDQTKTCMHCRFYQKFLIPIQANLNSQQGINKLHKKLKQKEREVNGPVVLLGECSPGTATKFSVLGGDSLSMVHIHFTPSGCIATCQNGLCPPQTIKSRVPRVIPLDELEQGNMCDHLFTLYKNNDILEDLFPEYFQNQDPTLDVQMEDRDPAEIVDSDVINTDDIGIRQKPGNISFDIDEGKWTCNSHSRYTPCLNRFDPGLVKSAGERLHSCCNPLQSGYFKGPNLYTPIKTPEGEERHCLMEEVEGEPCGEVYTEQTAYLKRPVLVYARHVSIVAIVHNILQSCPFIYITIVHC